MASPTITSSVYNETCAPAPLPCTTTEFLTSPCDCKEYIQCDNGDFIYRQCAQGTLFDDVNKRCESEAAIIAAGRCNVTEPWLRCSAVFNSFSSEHLSDSCSTKYNAISTTILPITRADSDASDIGPVIGGAVAGVVVVVVVVAVLVFLKLKRKRLNLNTTKRTRSNSYAVTSHTKTSGGDDDDVYDVIDERAVSSRKFSNPEYANSVSIKGQLNLGFEPTPHSVQRPTESYRLDKGVCVSPPSSMKLDIPNDERDDLSRTVSISGQDVLIEDTDGYQVAHPSGAVPRLLPREESTDNFYEGMDTQDHTYEGFENYDRCGTDDDEPSPEYFTLEDK